MNKGELLLWFASLLPEWMYGRTLLAKIAMAYIMINAIHEAHKAAHILEA